MTSQEVPPGGRVQVRAPLDPVDVLAALPDPARFSIRHVGVTGSTNAELAAGPPVAAAGPWPVLVAQEQLAGRGRAGRSWTSPPGAGLTVSIRIPLAPVVPNRRGWLGIVLGLAAAMVLDRDPALSPTLKWPNDLLLDGRKCAGILAVAVGDDVVVGMGLNVSLTTGELPRPDATSLLLAGAAELDRARLLAGILTELAVLVDRWYAAGGDVDRSGIRSAYLQRCDTLGRPVRLQLPDGSEMTGTATDVDPDGAVVVRNDSGRWRFSAGDVTHLTTVVPRS